MKENHKNHKIFEKNTEHEDISQMKGTDTKFVRETILTQQGGKCKLCNEPITEETGISLDHQHKLKSQDPDVLGKGLIRGVLCRSCNVWEGKIWNNTSRYRQPEDVYDRIEMLKKLIDYYEEGTYPLIHPSEKPKEPVVSKRNYNKLKRIYNKRKKFPCYPKSGKLTKELGNLFNEYGIEPYN